MKYCSILFVICFLSCVKNPDADLQNQQITFLKEKQDYLKERINLQEATINDLEKRVENLENSKFGYSRKKHLKKSDTINLNVKLNTGVR